MAKNNKYDLLILAGLIATLCVSIYTRVVESSYSLQFIKSGMYICVYIAWGYYVRWRVTQIQVRDMLLAIDGLMILWMAVKCLKYTILDDTVVERFLWYLFYVPMMYIPLLAMLITLSLNKPEDYRLPKWTFSLMIVSTAIVILVLTNDYHQLVFNFPDDIDSSYWNEYVFKYNFGYYFALLWGVLCGIVAFIGMIVKCRVRGSNRIIWLPLVPLVIAIVYVVQYAYEHIHGDGWVRLIVGDMTAFQCLCYTIFLECCIRSGLIRGNTRYRSLFNISTIKAGIVDNDYNVRYKSEHFGEFPEEVYREADHAPVMISEGIRLCSSAINGGHVLWQEDVSETVRTLDELRELNEALQDRNIAVRDEYETTKRKLQLMEANRLYHKMKLETRDKVDKLRRYLEELKITGDSERENELLYRMSVLGVYIKRRNNMLFLAEEEKTISQGELERSIDESLRCLKIRGVEVDSIIDLKSTLSFYTAVRIYDVFEDIIELCLDGTEFIFVKVDKPCSNCILHIAVSGAINPDNLESCEEIPGLEITREDDKEWIITYITQED